MSIAYTNHIGRSSRDKHSGKNTAISSIGDLAAVEKHNNHDYTQADVGRMQSDINLDQKIFNRQYKMVAGELVEVEGHLDIEGNVRKIYKEQFDAAIAEHNRKQIYAGHPERQIRSYIDKISEDKQQEVAVEGLIQFGSYEDWEGKSMAERQQAAPLLLQCLRDTISELKSDDAEFILAGASIHLNEGSPHLHYVGVPVQNTPYAKNGLTKRVKKSAVFTRETLGDGLQDNVRAKIEPAVKKTFGWEFDVKKSGRNKDLTKNEIANDKLQEQIHENETQLRAINLAVNNTFAAVEQDLKAQIEQRITAVALDQNGAYDNAMFFLSVCSDDFLLELNREGQRMKEQLLTTRAASIGVQQGMERLIGEAKSGKRPPREISWTERQARWETFNGVSNSFWAYRSGLQDIYHSDLTAAYQERRNANQSYYDALDLLYRSRSLLVQLFATIWALLEIERAKMYDREIQSIRQKLNDLAENTKDFATFSRAYRNDLKAGKMPFEEHLEAMAQIVRKLDAEHQAFLRQNNTKQKELALPADPGDR